MQLNAIMNREETIH